MGQQSYISHGSWLNKYMVTVARRRRNTSVCGSRFQKHTESAARGSINARNLWFAVPETHGICGSRFQKHTESAARGSINARNLWFAVPETHGICGSRLHKRTQSVVRGFRNTRNLRLAVPETHGICGSRLHKRTQSVACGSRNTVYTLEGVKFSLGGYKNMSTGYENRHQDGSMRAWMSS